MILSEKCYCKPVFTQQASQCQFFSYHQAQSSVLLGLRKLGELGVPTQRPEDYYAEMVKTDDHMRRVRQCLLSRQKVLEHKEKARKMRELKKYGKKVSLKKRVGKNGIKNLLLCRFSTRFCRREGRRKRQLLRRSRSSRKGRESGHHFSTVQLERISRCLRKISHHRQLRSRAKRGQWRGRRNEC